ncbi:hypothetical protein BGZ92_007686 [Podila epicladia]|nr:hypothetical protein BGZ92_007686 [Podila epicladia]
MNTHSPVKLRSSQSPRIDYFPSTPKRTRPISPAQPAVDTLLLPGVIGTTVQGPKTPIRSPPNNNMFPSTLSRENSASRHNRLQIDSPRRPSASSPSMSRYVDAEVALSPTSEQLPRDLPLGRYGFKSPSRNTLTSSDQWRKSIRQQDTPVAVEKRSDASYFHQTLRLSDSEDDIINNNGHPDDHPSQRRPQKQQVRHDHESPRSRKRRQEAAQRVPVNHRQDSDYEVEDEEEAEDEDDGEGLDIGIGEDEQYYYQSPYPDAHDSEEEYREEELTPEQLAFEEAERKREKEQIGFLERVTNFFWNQMDDIGATPKNLQQYHQLQQRQQPQQNHSASDSDASAYSLTSARARSRKAPLRRRSKPGLFLVPSLPKRGSFNVPSMRHLDSGIGMTSWIDERRRSESRDGEIHQREQSSRASVHVDQHSPQELYSDHYQKQQPLHQDDVEEHSYGRPRRRTPSKEYVRPAAMEPAQRNPAPRVYPWHVLRRLMSMYTQRILELYQIFIGTLQVYLRTMLAWIQFAITWPWLHRDDIRYCGERFIRAGMETGLFRPGTLSRLALLGLVLLVANWIGSEYFTRCIELDQKYGIKHLERDYAASFGTAKYASKYGYGHGRQDMAGLGPTCTFTSSLDPIQVDQTVSLKQ